MVISQLGSRHFRRQMDSLKMDLQSDRSFELVKSEMKPVGSVGAVDIRIHWTPLSRIELVKNAARRWSIGCCRGR